MGFDARTCGISVSIGAQSPDIAQGVDTAFEVRSGTSGEDLLNAQGAGDQGMMFGYACDETADLMPMPIWLAHRLAQRLTQVRKDSVLNYLRPDGKTQVTFDYEDGKPTRLRTVLISTQHAPGVDLETLLKPDLRDHVIAPLVPEEFADDDYQVLANPTGKFELGGPHADAGLTGRKIIVDTYGGAARHGGGAFSGKDPPRSTVRPPTRPGGWPSTWWPPVPPAAARSRSPTPSAWPSRCRSWWRRSAPRRSTRRRSPRRSGRSSTSARPRSSGTSICAGPSTARPRRTGTSVAPTRTSPGSRPTALKDFSSAVGLVTTGPS